MLHLKFEYEFCPLRPITRLCGQCVLYNRCQLLEQDLRRSVVERKRILDRGQKGWWVSFPCTNLLGRLLGLLVWGSWRGEELICSHRGLKMDCLG